jgi:hydroxymethylbilane synthase
MIQGNNIFMKKIIIATRASELAVCQAEFVAKKLKEICGIKSELLKLTTKGDTVLDKPISNIEGKGIFTREIDSALLEGKADLAVHSMKDLPVEFPKNILLVAVPEREDPNDALISFSGEELEKMPQGATIATGSLRRELQLKQIRPDIVIKGIRGNIQTRIRKAKENNYNGLIIAMAAVNRLCLQKMEDIKIFPLKNMLYAPAQGALAVTAIKDNIEIKNIAQKISCQKTLTEIAAERKCLQGLGAGCNMPFGLRTTITPAGELHITAAVFPPNEREQNITATISGSTACAKALGEQIAKDLIISDSGKFLMC